MKTLPRVHCKIVTTLKNGCAPPRVGSGVVRIDLLHFLAGCHTSRLNWALSVLSLSLGFLMYVLCIVILCY